MCAYNVFRRSEPDGLSCAVPEERSVPTFLVAPQWRFDGRIDSPAGVPLGFDGRAAATGVRFNGFYLFASFQESASRAENGA